MKTTIIIPNYNGMKFLEDCLNALEKQKHKFDIIVVDNGSTDESVMYLKEAFPSVKVIEAGVNAGFSAAVNRGIRASITPYVLLLNNDTVVRPDFVRNLEDELDKRPDYFGIQAKMLMQSDNRLMDDAGDFYCALGWAFARGKGKPQEKYQTFCKVFAPCAGAAIYRKSIMEQIGLFDEEHFAYLEDIDIAYRAKIAGFKNGFCPTAVVEHAGSGSSGSRYNEFKVRLAARNSIYLIYKNMPFLQILINMPFLLAGFTIKAIFFIKKGFGKIYLKSLADGLKLCFSRKIKAKKVRFSAKKLHRYIKLEIELLYGILQRFFY